MTVPSESSPETDYQKATASYLAKVAAQSAGHHTDCPDTVQEGPGTTVRGSETTPCHRPVDDSALQHQSFRPAHYWIVGDGDPRCVGHSSGSSETAQSGL